MTGRSTEGWARSVAETFGLPLAEADRLAAAFAEGVDCGCEVLVPCNDRGNVVPGSAIVDHTCGKQHEDGKP